MRKDTWSTYRTVGYSHDVAQDHASAGGVHHHQVRKVRRGWETRILQTNGRHKSAGAVESIAPDLGEELYALAKKH